MHTKWPHSGQPMSCCLNWNTWPHQSQVRTGTAASSLHALPILVGTLCDALNGGTLLSSACASAEKPNVFTVPSYVKALRLFRPTLPTGCRGQARDTSGDDCLSEPTRPKDRGEALSQQLPTLSPVTHCLCSLATDEDLFAADKCAPPSSPAHLPDLAELDLLLNNL